MAWKVIHNILSGGGGKYGIYRTICAESSFFKTKGTDHRYKYTRKKDAKTYTKILTINLGRGIISFSFACVFLCVFPNFLHLTCVAMVITAKTNNISFLKGWCYSMTE